MVFFWWLGARWLGFDSGIPLRLTIPDSSFIRGYHQSSPLADFRVKTQKKKFETHSNAGCPPSSKVIKPQPKQEKIHKKTFWNHHVTIVIIVFFCLPLKLIVYHHLSSIITIYHLSSPFIIMSYHLIIIDHSFPPNFLGDVKIPPSKNKQTKKDMKLFSLSQWTLK